jgi:hypothetical protein
MKTNVKNWFKRLAQPPSPIDFCALIYIVRSNNEPKSRHKVML